MTDPKNSSSSSLIERRHRENRPLRDRRHTVVVTMPKGWVRTGLSSVEAALLGWAFPTLFAVMGLMAEGSSQWMHGANITEAATVGTNFWALSLGVPMVVGGLPISLIPLFWSAMQVLILRGLLVGGKGNSVVAVWTAVPFFMATSAIITAAAPGNLSISSVLFGSFLVSFLAALWSVLCRVEIYPKWFCRLGNVWSGIRTGAWWFLLLGVTSLVTLSVSMFQSRQEMVGVSEILGVTGVSAMVLAVLQIVYVPTFGAWAISWLSGAGFTVAGETCSPTSMVQSPLPLFPVTKMLPTTTVGMQVVLILIGVGVLVGVATSWQFRHLSYIGVVERSLTASLFFSFLVGTWFTLSRGALGSERMAHLGPVISAWPLVVAEISLVATLIILSTHPKALKEFRVLINSETLKGFYSKVEGWKGKWFR